MEIKELNEDLIEDAAKFYVCLFQHIKEKSDDPYFELEDSSFEDMVNTLKKSLENNNVKILLAFEDDVPIGLLSGEIINCFLPLSKVKKIGYLPAAYVDSKYRNKGTMKQLEQEMIKFFKRNGLEYAELNIITKNSFAKTYWNKLGYETFREQMRKQI